MAKPGTTKAPTDAWPGTVVAAYGRRCIVQADDGKRIPCQASSRHMHPVCGDRVSIASTGTDCGRVVSISDRKNLFSRSGSTRTKHFAANISQLAIITACEPPVDDDLLARMLIGATDAGLEVVVILNKSDLSDRLPTARAALAPFRDLGHRVIEMSAREEVSALRAALDGHRTLLIGQSGMGKSTIVNRLVPDANARTAEISSWLGTGKQTTTASHLYGIGPRSEIIDSPGVSRFGLAGMGADAIQGGFPEFIVHASGCRFADCMHLSEPQCAVGAAAESGLVHPRRLALYRRILENEIPARGRRN